MKRKRTATWCAAALVTLAITSCGIKKTTPITADVGEAVGGAGTLDPKPTNPNTLQAQLSRYEGQTKYLNWHYPTYNRFGGPVPMAAAMKGGELQSGAVAREIKFSDVYSFGPDGEKTLVLLNNVGGMQIISYDKGATNPELIGEVEATFNNPEDMYFDATTKRAYVLETNWIDDAGQYSWARDRNTKLHIYNLENPKAPFIAKSIEIQGELADSRMVGNKDLGEVLYVVTSEYPYNWWNASTSYGNTGHVFAYRLDGDDATLANGRGYTLSKRVASWRRNMNITQDGKEKFYLTAVLEGGWMQPNEIEVLDISDPKGAVSHVMTVSPRGQVSERTSTMVKNATLLAVSSFRPQATEDQPFTPAHIAVESFTFPGDKPTIITKLKAERNLAYIKDGVAEGKDYRTLVSNEVFGLRGVFVKTDVRNWDKEQPFKLHKLVADSEHIIEPKLSTPQEGQPATRMEAQLHDVRPSTDGNRLYVFWVPGQVDPLDVFDITQPEKGLVHLGHTEFQGWVERSFPITFNKQNYIIGLGRAGTGNLRSPQVTLFKVNEVVTQEGEKKTTSVEAPIVSHLNMDGTGVYVEFNTREDKYIAEPKISADGKGSILFQITSWKKGETYQYFSGGQLIGVDLSKAPVGKDNKKVDGVFWQGALLATTNSDAMRRTFANPKVEQGFNTFSDRYLGTYQIEGSGKAGEPVTAKSVLELTRTVKAYVTMKTGDKLTGVQIVSDDSTQLRLVPTTHANARMPVQGGLSKLDLPGGNYLDHLVASDGSLVVLTSKVEYRDTPVSDSGRNSVAPRRSRNSVQVLTASRVVLDAGKPTLKSTVAWEKPLPNFWGGPIFFAARTSIMPPWGWNASKAELVELQSKHIVVSDGQTLRLVALSGQRGVSFPVLTTSCTPKSATVDSTQRGAPSAENAPKAASYTGVSVETLNGSLYASFSELVEDPSREIVRADWSGVTGLTPGGTTPTLEGGRRPAERPPVRPPEPKKVREKLKFERRFVSVAELGTLTEKGEVPLVCKQPINVPGKIIALVPGKKAALFEDGRVADVQPRREGEFVSYEPVLRNALVSVKLEAKDAPLASLYDPGDVPVASMSRVDEATFAHVETDGYSTPVLALLTVDDKLAFRKQWRELPVTLAPDHGPQLLAIVRDEKRDSKSGESFLAVILAGRKAQLVGLSRDKKTLRLADSCALKKVIPVSLEGKPEKDRATDSFMLFSSGIYFYGSRGAQDGIATHFTTSQRSFEFALDQYGVKQLFVEN